ncbi:hypothetical protein FOL47_008958 [Perkinsus chesapeaki]|uniref:Uncharacterized protein n=1 Tax=Perkinsus chesapeaki TaxID=330153 RepID=A0A7J6N1Z7_PERCH|nr:hypothetical protein FOL47_008958 [Perkinsus chesapeaki]
MSSSHMTSHFPGVLRVTWELIPEVNMSSCSTETPWTGVACWPCPDEETYDRLAHQLHNLRLSTDNSSSSSVMGVKEIEDLEKVRAMLSAALRATKYLKDSVERENSMSCHNIDAPLAIVDKPTRSLPTTGPCSSESTTPRSSSSFASRETAFQSRDTKGSELERSSMEIKLSEMRKRFAIPPSPRRLEREASGVNARSRKVLQAHSSDPAWNTDSSFLQTVQSARTLPLRSPRADSTEVLTERASGRPPRVAPLPFTMGDLSIYNRR